MGLVLLEIECAVHVFSAEMAHKPVYTSSGKRRQQALFRAYCPKIYCSKISGFCYGLFRMLKFLSFREWSKKFRFSVKNQSLTQKMTEAKKIVKIIFMTKKFQ